MIRRFLCPFRVCFETVDVHLLTDLEHEKDGEDSAHWFVVILDPFGLLHLPLQARPEGLGAVHKLRVEELTMEVTKV